jgi:hypothetical protein
MSDEERNEFVKMIFLKLDADKNGVLSKEETKELMEHIYFIIM